MIRHIVLFTLNDHDGGDDLIEWLQSLPDHVPVIEVLAVGRSIRAGTHEYALTVDVADEGALEEYRNHPAHVPVAERLREVAVEVAVADIVI